MLRALLSRLFAGSKKTGAKGSQDTPQVAYVEWSCLDSACKKGRELEKWIWLPHLSPTPPLAECNRKDRCPCLLVYILEEERGAKDVLQILNEVGGKALRKDMEKRLDLERKEQASKQKQVSDMSTEARELEKHNSLQAVELYRKCIDGAIANQSGDEWDLRDLPYWFNRLTLLLEREKRWEEALQEIERYEDTPLQWVNKQEKEALAKRKIRIGKKLGMPQAGNTE